MVSIALSVLSGILLSGAFEPVGKWWLAPIALAVHMYALTLTQRKIVSTFLFAVVANSIVLHWSSTFVGAIPWLILSVGMSLFYLPLALVARWGIASYPLIYMVMEEVRNRFPFGGFGWVRLAYTQADAPYSKIAAAGGVAALSAVVALLALFIFHLLHKRFVPVALLPLALLLIPINLTEVGQTKVMMVQGNVPQLGLDFNSRAKAVFNNHFELTKSSLAQESVVDFVLWPENSVDVDPFTNLDVKKSLDSIQRPLIVGAVMYKGNKLLNTSILWGGELPPIYIKQHLTPFGEYIPLRSLASKISPLTNRVRDFEPGQGSQFFAIQDAVIAPVICFELLDDEILRKAATGSNLMAVQTNSATFGFSAESAQQLSITRVRAIQHGRNIVSVSTTGYSAVIDHHGKVLQKSSMGTAEVIRARVGLIQGQTPSDKAGGWALIGTLIFLCAVAAQRYRQRR